MNTEALPKPANERASDITCTLIVNGREQRLSLDPRVEHTVYDQKHRRVVTNNLADFAVPVNADVPNIDVTFVEHPDLVINPMDAGGPGEIGITGVAPAMANAIYHATGIRVRDLPITPDKLLTLVS
jgi:CO/xanthine dehydrogenase Mo-binding subunit